MLPLLRFTEFKINRPELLIKPFQMFHGNAELAACLYRGFLCAGIHHFGAGVKNHLPRTQRSQIAGEIRTLA